MYSIILKQNNNCDWNIIVKQNGKLYSKFSNYNKGDAFKKAIILSYYFGAFMKMEK